MSDNIKAQKLAAARKKLKEFQQKHKSDYKAVGTEKTENLTSVTHSSEEDLHKPKNSKTDIIYNNDFMKTKQGTENGFTNEKFAQDTNLSSIVETKSDTDESNKFYQFNMVNFDQAQPSIFDTQINLGFDVNIIDGESSNTLEDNKNETENSSQSNEQLQESRSSSESLKQLSQQINNLVNDDDFNLQSNIHCNNNQLDLEKRNQELASLLQNTIIERDTLKAQIIEKDNKIQTLYSEQDHYKLDFQTKLNREVSSLKEQLQTHAQTLGILVAEKTELSTSLSQCQSTLKQKIIECEELQGRLRTSRGRVADLEKELNNLRQEKSKTEKVNRSEELEEQTKEINSLKQQVKELTEDLSEIKQKYTTKDEENKDLRNQVRDITHQLSLAQLRIQQVTAGEKYQNDVQVENLIQEKIQLEKRIKELSDSLTSVITERDQSSIQYQQYTEQLNEQMSNLATRLQNLTEENERLSNREHELIHHIGELEKRLQNIQEEQLKTVSSVSEDNGLTMELKNLQDEKELLSKKYMQLLEEKRLLEEEVHFHEEKEKDLAEHLEQAQQSQPDMKKLLASMESDKIAAARAVTQNGELKAQLEEMQLAFVKASNDKMELMEKLTSLEHQNNELLEKYEVFESQLKKLENALEIKDKELLKERESSEYLNKQILQYDQLNDRLRHYEANDASAASLQNEIQQLNQQLQTLMAENSRLKDLVRENENTSKKIMKNSDQQTVSNSEIESFQQEIVTGNQESNDRNKELLDQYSKQIESLELKNKELELEVYKTNKYKILSQTTSDNNNDSNFTSNEILDKEKAMKFLEEKFLQTMEEVAKLTEEKQRLEHIVTQLQGETETIGEYVALYQHQRAILQQRTLEKDQQLKKLQEDRTEVKSKLDLLNSLVKKLIEEKGPSVTSELLRQEHKHSDSELCSEHAYIQEEINRIKEQNLLNGTNNVNESMDTSSNSTAQQIISLLSEIKTSSLVQSPDILDNFHPCGWCSGRLITI